jgi:hypothetical protein
MMANRGQFKPGQSGNPTGKPRGARHRATVAAEALLDGEAEALTRRAVELALEGDTTALKMCMDRILPPRKGRPINFTLPELTNTGDLRATALAILGAVSEGDISPEEAAAVAPLIEGVRKTMETDELSRRLEALEQALEGRGGRP